MKELIEALDVLQERYESEDRITDDRLDRLKLTAQINVVRDLRELLSAPSGGSDRG